MPPSLSAPGYLGVPSSVGTCKVEVLGQVARGFTNQQVAQALTVSPHIAHRVTNTLTKLDQPTRAAAVRVAMTRGIL